MAIFSFFSKKKKNNDEKIEDSNIESPIKDSLGADLETEETDRAIVPPIEETIDEVVAPMADILTDKPVIDPDVTSESDKLKETEELKEFEDKVKVLDNDLNMEFDRVQEEPQKESDYNKVETKEKKGFFSSLFSKREKEDLDKGLEKTKSNIFSKLAKAVAGKSKVDDEVLDNLEEILVTSDVGVETTLKIIKQIETRVSRDKYLGTEELNKILKEEIMSLLSETQTDRIEGFDFPKRNIPYVIMVVGVNGVGKTTTIGKLAYQFKKAGKSVMLGASDTFRAAAVDQLVIWSERVDVPIVTQGMGADPASVAFDTLKSAIANNVDVVLIDTAGRLHNKINLMNELSKIRNVMKKLIPDAPQEVLLVLDATTGQNAIEQAKQFTAATDVTTLALTKLDGTAKGGVAIGISDQFNIPIKYIGVGEKIDQLQLFNKEAFVNSLFGE